MSRDRRSQLLPAFAMLFEMLALASISVIQVNIRIRATPITNLFGIGVPHCWYLLYGIYVVTVALFVVGIWFAIRGRKASPFGSTFALALAVVWLCFGFDLWLPFLLPYLI